MDKLQITSEDGRTGIFDVSPYLEFEAFVALKNQDAFMSIMNGGYFVEWDCGLIYQRILLRLIC